MIVGESQKTLNATGATVAIMLVLLLGIAIGALLTQAVPAANMNVLLVLLGALATNVTNVAQFFFGNSVSNRQKDSTISALSATTATQATTAANVQPEVK